MLTRGSQLESKTMADDHGVATIDDPMDMPEHEATYAGFVQIVEMGVLYVLGILLILMLWTLEGHGFVALIGFILLTLAAGLGGLLGVGWRAVAPIFLLLGLACIVL